MNVLWTGVLGLVVGLVLTRLYAGVYNYFLHPLKQFPGPQVAAVTTWYKTWQEVFLGRSWIEVLTELHTKYGDVVRISPNEVRLRISSSTMRVNAEQQKLHFSKPAAYNDIYNNSNRWDKEHVLYRSFGEDRSSFGFLTYREAKQRKDVLAPLFAKRAVAELQSLVINKIERLCSGLSAQNAAGKSSDFLYGLRCFTADTIMQFCFAQDIKAGEAPDFKAPIVVAMDTSLASFTVFRNFEAIRRVVFGMPGWITKLTTPPMAGLVDLQELLGAQVTRVVNDPGVLKNADHPIIYHRLLDSSANKSTGIPSAGSLYEEAQALLFGGADSAGNTAAVGMFNVIQRPEMYTRLKKEILSIWPNLGSPPPYEKLESLSYLSAVIKESLRTAPGVPAPLLRVVPISGAVIDGHDIPQRTVVGMSAVFVHSSAEVFKDPRDFNPNRWLQPESSRLDTWLVPFSKGPRACIGQNLAMCELYIAFSYLFRKFDIEIDRAHKEWPRWKEAFLPSFDSEHAKAFFKPVGR